MSGKTLIIKMSEETLKLPENILKIRNINENDFIENHGSGTLRKAKRLGTAYKSLYKEERVAYDFGWEFKVVPNSRITYNDAIAEGDCHSFTEACWHAERYLMKNPFEEDDIYEFKYIIVEECEGCRYEGIGLICRQTNAQYIGDGNTLFCIIAEYDNEKKEWKDARNPF
jgi:hypothetical protein